jgi:hypothetical protein
MPVVVSVAFFGLQRSAAAVRYPDICVCFGCFCSTLLSGKDFSSFKFSYFEGRFALECSSFSFVLAKCHFCFVRRVFFLVESWRALSL